MLLANLAANLGTQQIYFIFYWNQKGLFSIAFSVYNNIETPTENDYFTFISHNVVNFMCVYI